jgi:hypothetical protein
VGKTEFQQIQVKGRKEYFFRIGTFEKTRRFTAIDQLAAGNTSLPCPRMAQNSFRRSLQEALFEPLVDPGVEPETTDGTAEETTEGISEETTEGTTEATTEETTKATTQGTTNLMTLIVVSSEQEPMDLHPSSRVWILR